MADLSRHSPEIACKFSSASDYNEALRKEYYDQVALHGENNVSWGGPVTNEEWNDLRAQGGCLSDVEIAQRSGVVLGKGSTPTKGLEIGAKSGLEATTPNTPTKLKRTAGGFDFTPQQPLQPRTGAGATGTGSTSSDATGASAGTSPAGTSPTGTQPTKPKSKTIWYVAGGVAAATLIGYLLLRRR